jgi:thiamine transport system ATP-binding protein
MLRLDGVVLGAGAFRLSADLTLPAGGMTAVLGPSGQGKSTLLAGIAGFTLPLRGRILWQGADLTDRPPGDRPVAMLFQDQNLFPHLTLAQNVGLALAPRLRLTPADQARVAAALDSVGLATLADRRPGAVSGGEGARAALARVLLQDRPVVLLDEPFGALGPALKAGMLDLCAQRLAGRTVLMVTHDPADALRIAPQSVVVAEGRVTGPFPTAALLADPPPALASYLAPGPRGA